MARRVFHDYFSLILRAVRDNIDQVMSQVTPKLFSNKLICWKLVKNVFKTPELSPFAKASILMCAIDNVIEIAHNERPFKKFCRVMKPFQFLKSLAAKLTKEFG